MCREQRVDGTSEVELYIYSQTYREKRAVINMYTHMYILSFSTFYDFVTGHINDPVIAYYYNWLPVGRPLAIMGID